jgi:prepilin-type N-terminal cleavage/methylation domain-containing protein
MKTGRQHLRQRGFTLVELLVTIGIIAVLASVVVLLSSKWIRRAKRVESIGNIRTLAACRAFGIFDNVYMWTWPGIAPPWVAVSAFCIRLEIKRLF